MASLSPKNALLALLAISCLATIGLYVLVNQDVVKESVKQLSYFHTRLTLDNVTTDHSDVRTSKVISDINNTRHERKPVNQTADEAEETDTNYKRINRMGIEHRNMIDLDIVGPRELMNRTVIVTAISQNHLKESSEMIGSVQEFLPNTRIIIYNLGLSPSGVKEVQRLCNVELRSFNFSKYPPHVKNLHSYAWKPLIIADTLGEFGVIFWCDSSARFKKDPLVLFSVLQEQSGFMRRIVEFKPNKMLARTHPKMFEYLGIDRDKFRNDHGYAMCIEAGRVLCVNSALLQAKIIVPWVDCAMHTDCISPKGSVLQLNVNGPSKHTHRFDQAALSLITYKNMRGVWNEQNDRTGLLLDVVGIARSHLHDTAKVCEK